MRTQDLLAQQLLHKIYSSVNCTYHVVQYSPSTYLSYNQSLYLLTAFIQFPVPPSPCLW